MVFDLSKWPHLLHKMGFVDSLTHTTVYVEIMKSAKTLLNKLYLIPNDLNVIILPIGEKQKEIKVISFFSCINQFQGTQHQRDFKCNRKSIKVCKQNHSFQGFQPNGLDRSINTKNNKRICDGRSCLCQFRVWMLTKWWKSISIHTY